MAGIWTAVFTDVVVFIMVLARTAGIFTFNPIFSRNGVPNTFRAGFSFVLAIVITAAGNFSYNLPDGLLPFAFDLVKEIFVGAILGLFVNLMLQVFSMAGEVTDMQLGLSMAKSYDPTFGQAGLTTNYYSYWFMLYFFAVGGHKSYIQLISVSFDSIPIGYESFNINILYIIVMYFETVLTLALKLAMPVVAASLITEFCIGVLMKAVPTIHVFVLNIQLKMLVGFVVLAASAPAVGEFLEMIMGVLFENLNGIVTDFTG